MFQYKIKTFQKDVVHRYCGILFSYKKEWSNAICSNMEEPEITTLSEVGEWQISYAITYMWNLKNTYTSQLIHKTETEAKTQKTNLQLSKGKEGAETNQVFRISKYKLLYIKQTTRAYCVVQGIVFNIL